MRQKSLLQLPKRLMKRVIRSPALSHKQMMTVLMQRLTTDYMRLTLSNFCSGAAVGLSSFLYPCRDRAISFSEGSSLHELTHAPGVVEEHLTNCR